MFFCSHYKSTYKCTHLYINSMNLWMMILTLFCYTYRQISTKKKQTAYNMLKARAIRRKTDFPFLHDDTKEWVNVVSSSRVPRLFLKRTHVFILRACLLCVEFLYLYVFLQKWYRIRIWKKAAQFFAWDFGFFLFCCCECCCIYFYIHLDYKKLFSFQSNDLRGSQIC